MARHFFLSAFLLFFSLGNPVFGISGKPPVAGQGPDVQAADVPDSPAGLQAQFEEMITAKDKKHDKRREQLIDQLQIPDADKWFPSVFGNDAGEKLAATYRSTWEKFEDSLTSNVSGLSSNGKTHISAKEISIPSKPAADAATEFSKPTSAIFYAVTAAKDKEPGSPLPGVYVYVQGAFRCINWQTLYGLPGVKPMRIRIGGNVALAQLLQHVNPVYPDDARAKKVPGTVILHVVIDTDGRVMEVQPVSGPTELVEASENAVRQWRYQPTLLNGDPVQIDTLVSVVFSLH
jgi:TonB family protein